MKKEYSKPEITIEELQKMLTDANEKLEASNKKLEMANEELEAANAKLKEQERERTEFFANLSHDLRASVSVIAGGVELLQTDAGPGTETAEMLSMIQKRTGFLQSLIEDMFLLAKLESVPHRELQSIDLRLFLEDYFYSVQADGSYGDRELCLEIADDFSGTGLMDPDLMVRVLDNLFTNAKKYSDPGARILLSAEAGGDEVIISVSDTGIGISEEDLPHIFERTFRSKRARTPEDGSSGLGLAIAEKIVENAGGSIECKSAPGVGSTFSIHLKRV